MTRFAGPTIEDIKRAANARPNDVLAWCGLREHFDSKTYILISNPMRADRHPSFCIWNKGGTVSFKDLAGGAQGDVLHLVAYCNGWYDQPKKGLRETCRYLTDKLGLGNVSKEQLERDRERSRRREAEILKKSDEDRARAEGRAQELFFGAQVDILDTPVDTYLREARGIDLRALPAGPRGGSRLPSVLRYLSEHEHRESGLRLPCMIAACVDYQSDPPAIRAVHRTWLRPDGRGKAEVDPPRKCFPGFAGLVIPLWNGDGNMTVRQACEAGLLQTLCLGEGVEDGLTMALGAPQHRVWAAISLSNIQNIVLPPCVDGVLIHRQNDWDKPQAVAAFDKGKAALEAQGAPVGEIAAAYGKDINDVLMGEMA